MGKNQRHKKNLKADKAKVKLKQTKTKFLPKGQNVTNTTFKIRPIILPEQLKEKQLDIPLSKRKLDIKDLVSRMKHYNENVRHKACEEMTDMVKIHSEEIINYHLSVTILAVSTLMQDRERKVRQAAIQVVNALLKTVPDEKMKPYYHYFVLHLRCAMTNINKNIQEDSLLFLDSFLLYNSKIITENPEKLLTAFFTLISKFRSDSNLGRMLTVNLGSKMTSVTWRIKVLSRLHAILENLLGKNLNNIFEPVDVGPVFDAESSYGFALYNTKFGDKLVNSVFNFKKPDSLNSSKENLEKNMVTVVPLLYETWIEVMPDNKPRNSSTENTILTEEAAAILACVMNTLYLFWKYITKKDKVDLIKNVFLSAEGKKFLDHLVRNFPYKQSENRKKAKFSNDLKLLGLNTDSKCHKENLLICLIYSALNINILRKTRNKEIDTIIDYISQLLTKRFLNETISKFLFEFLKMCLVDNYQMWKKSGIGLRSILNHTITFHNNTNLSEILKLELFNLLANFVKSPLVEQSEEYSSWLESLPDLLTEQSIHDYQINCLLDMSKRGSSIFNEALNKKIPEIMENLDNLNIIVTNPSLLNNKDVMMRNIANIFFFLPKIGKIKTRFILEYITTHQGTKYAKNLEKMLELRKEFNT